jgi:tetrahydromethanopterin S-methyltransferase subunit G
MVAEPERRSERNVPKSIKTQPIFETLLDEVVEMVANKSLKNFNQVSKKLETAIKKLDYDTAPVPDLIDKEVGKNLHTFLALVDKLGDIEAEDDEIESISKLRDFIIDAKGTVESRITRHVNNLFSI